MKPKINFRSDCPISSALDLIGDKWSLLIIRDLVYEGERTFKDFSNAAEAISSARLSDRLSKLEALGMIKKKDHPTNKKVFLYSLTRKGADLFPVISEFILWSDKYLHAHISRQAREFAKKLRGDKENTVKFFVERVSS